MASDKWYNEDTMPAPGTELFRSTRRFQLWHQTVSHRQLLFRATPGSRDTRIDLLFKPVKVMQLHTVYDGLVVRLAEQNGREYRFELESGDIRDFVTAYAFGWHEDNGKDNEPSGFDESFAPHLRPERPKVAVPLDDLVAALQAGEKRSSEPDKYRYVHVIMLRLSSGGAGAIGAYLSRGEAEEAIEARRADDREAVARTAAPDASIADQMLAARADVELWIDTIPIQL